MNTEIIFEDNNIPVRYKTLGLYQPFEAITMNQVQIKKFVIRNEKDVDATPLEEKERFYRVESIFGAKGLYLKVFQTPIMRTDRTYTAKVWYYRYSIGGRARKYFIGDTRFMSYMEAQRIHTDCYYEVKSGIDIVAQRNELAAKAAAKPNRRPFNKVVELWLAEYESTVCNRTYYMVNSRLNVHVLPPLGKLSAVDITRQDIVKIRDQILAKSPSMASPVLTVIKQVLNFAADNNWVERNVAVDVKPKYKTKKREWHFSDGELKRIWAALDAPTTDVYISWQTAAIMKMLICLGSRLEEVVGLRKEEITFADTGEAVILLGKDRTKTKIDFRIFVGKELCEKVLKPAMKLSGDSPFLFPSPYKQRQRFSSVTSQNVSKTRRSLLMELGIKGVTHTTRATMLSTSMELGLDGVIADSCLGHMPKGTMAIYMKSFNFPKQRNVWQSWQNHVFSIVEGKVEVQSAGDKVLNLFKGQ